MDIDRLGNSHAGVRNDLQRIPTRVTTWVCHGHVLRDSVRAVVGWLQDRPCTSRGVGQRGLVPLLFFLLSLGGCPHPLPSIKGDGLFVTRSYLASGKSEVWGYGAYSYVLLPTKPGTNPRYLALLTAYAELPLDKPPHPDQQPTPLALRNITYVPVEQRPAAERLEPNWLIANYDASRAASLIHSQGLVGPGPFLVTHKRRPLSVVDSRKEVAVLDLSAAPPQSMRLWLEHFVRVSQAPDEWSRGVESVLLNLNNLLISTYDGLALTIEALEPVGKIARAGALSK